MRKAVLFLVALALVAAAWELYKSVGPEAGGEVLGWNILPKTSRNAMPHVWDMGARLFDTESRTSSRQIWRVVLAGVWYSFRLALLGLVIGASVGVALAVLMARFNVVRRGLLPYLIVSQTVPLIALAPLVASWGGRLQPFGWECAEVDVGGAARRLPRLLPDLGRDLARARVDTGDVARVDA